MGKTKDLFILICALLFAGLVNLEPIAHEHELNDVEIYEYECEFCENHNVVEPVESEKSIPNFLIENNYLFKIYIHSSLLRKAFLSRAPPKS